MKKEIEQLRERYRNAKTKKELAAIEKEMSALAEQDNARFSEAMVALARETAEEAADLAIRQQLESALPMISIAYIAKNYFGKSKEWLYQRINGNMVNGKPAKLTAQEIDTLNAALQDMGKILLSTRVS